MKKTLKDILLNLGYCSRPDFLIIGAQKAGTSALYTILNKHSKIQGSNKKEIHYFDNDAWYSERNLSAYHSYFPLPHHVSKGAKMFEATPMYLFHPEVAKRLYDYKPDLKLIISLRNPVERAFSAWTMFHYHFDSDIDRQRHDPRSFSEAISEELSTIDETNFYENRRAYVKRGIYHYQLERFLEYFPSDQILILESKELRAQFEEVARRIQSFLDVPYEKLKLVEANQSKIIVRDNYQAQIRALQEFYRPHNQKLFNLIGKEFNWNVHENIVS